MALANGSYPITITATRADGVTNTYTGNIIIGDDLFANIGHIVNTQMLHPVTTHVVGNVGHITNVQTLHPVTPMQMVTLAGLDPESWLNNPPYIGNAGGDGNNVGAGDEIYYSLSTSPGGYSANISDMGIPSFDDGGAATEDQVITWYYRDAQNGYAESATQQFTLAVDNSIDAFIGSITNTQTLHAVEALIDAGGDITSNIGHITNSQALHSVQALLGTSDPIIVNLGSITNTQLVHEMTVTLGDDIAAQIGSISNTQALHSVTAEIDQDLLGNIGSITNLQTVHAVSALVDDGSITVNLNAITNSQILHPVSAIVELGPIEANIGHIVNTQILHSIYGFAKEFIMFQASLLTTSSNQITIFSDRENISKVTVKHDGLPVDLSVFNRFELYGLSDPSIDTSVNSGAISGDENGVISLDVSSLTTFSGLRSTTLIAYGPVYQDGVVLWDESMPRSSVSAIVVDTFTQEQGVHPNLINGIRLQIKSRTNGAALINATGFTVHLIEKGVSITGLNTDQQGYLIIQDESLDTLSEEIGVAIRSSDGNMTGFDYFTVEDLTNYLA